MYIIVELQTNNDQTSNIVHTEPTFNEAMSTFHSILSSAAISNIEYHTALVVNEKGEYVDRRCYEHHPSPDPEE